MFKTELLEKVITKFNGDRTQANLFDIMTVLREQAKVGMISN